MPKNAQLRTLCHKYTACETPAHASGQAWGQPWVHEIGIQCSSDEASSDDTQKQHLRKKTIPSPNAETPRPPPKTRKWNCQIQWFQKLRKQVSLFRSCTLCVQGSAQKQDVAVPPCRPPSLTLSVHSVREGPAPRARVSSLWALPCPSPGVFDPLRGAEALPFPPSPGGVTAANLVKARAKRPRAAAGR